MSECPAIPGPRGWPVVGNLVGYARDPLGYQDRLADSAGRFSRYRLGGQEVVLVTDPEAVREVFAAGSDKLVKGRALQAARCVVGDGLLTSEGDVHLRARRMLAPLFQPANLENYAGLMADATRRHIADWRPGEVRDVAGDMADLTLAIIARVLFRRGVEGETARIGRALADALRIVARLTIPLYRGLEWMPLPSHIRFRRALRYLDELVYRLIEERRGAASAPADLLARLLSAEDAEGDARRLSDRQARDEVMTLFLAGHETVANGMAWTFHLLGHHADADERLARELRDALGDRLPTAADVGRLPYTRQVVLESLRLRPPVWNVARRAVVDLDLAGHRIPAGTVIIASPWVSHRRGAFFDEPEAFRPERWDAADPRRRHRHEYFPFGGGRRVCIGEHFALQEMILVLATIARRWRLEPVRTEVPIQPTITIRPKGGLPMELCARAAR